MKRQNVQGNRQNEEAPPGDRARSIRLPSSFILHPSSCKNRVAFTLTELLVVIAIIVLFITLALPAFNLITGTRSIAAGTNEVAAFLGRARAEAIGLQQVRGVAFYVDGTGRSTMAIVHQPFIETPSSLQNYVAVNTYAAGSYYRDNTNRCWSLNSAYSSGVGSFETDKYAIDAESDTDVFPLPMGVGAQLLNNATIAAGARTTNGYVSFGAILFDGSGNLASGTISIAQNGIIGSTAGITSNLPNPSVAATPSTITSQFGVVLFDLQGYSTIGGSMKPQLIFGSTASSYLSSTEKTQESWIDSNSTPLLINRYNGTLIKSE